MSDVPKLSASEPTFDSPPSKRNMALRPVISPVEAAWSSPLAADSLGEPLTLRTRLPGDRFQPMGMDQEKKLQDFFIDQRVPRAWRDKIPLLVTGRGIAAVAGYRIAQWARIDLNRLQYNSVWVIICKIK